MKRYCLQSMGEKDLQLVLKWRNSPRVSKEMYTDRKITWEEHVNWFKSCQTSKEVENFLCYLEQEAIGVVSITDIDMKNRRCSWGIYIGREDAPKGSGTKMGYLALQHVFNDLKLQKIWVEVLANNAVSLKFHKKLGFRVEGIFRRHILKNGKYEDVVRFALFKKIFSERSRFLR